MSLPGEIVMRDPDAFYDFEAKYIAEDEAVLKVPADLGEGSARAPPTSPAAPSRRWAPKDWPGSTCS